MRTAFGPGRERRAGGIVPRRTGAAWVVVAAIPVILAAVGLAGIGGASSATVSGRSNGVAPDLISLTLIPTPAQGNAPLNGTVAASITGGVAPYALSLCFGTVDHSNANPHCLPPITDWSGDAPVEVPYAYSSPGNFSVVGIASDSIGESVGSTALIVVTSGSILQVRPAISVGSGTAPLNVSFTVTLLGGTPPFSIQWTFGDGTSGSSLPGLPVRHVYATPGTFAPVLRVSDGAGHTVVQPLGAVDVTAPPPKPDVSTPSVATTIQLLGLFGAGAGAIVILARAVQVHRWRQQGNEIVREITGFPEETGVDPPGRSFP